MRAILRIAQKDLRDLLRERSIVVALVVQFFIAAFSAFLTVGLLGLYDPESAPVTAGADVAYVGPGGFDRHLGAARGIEVAAMPLDEALRRFSAGEVDAVVEESYGDPAGARTLSVLVPDGEVQSTLLVTQLKGLLEAYEDDLRAERTDRLSEPLLEAAMPEGRPPLPYGFLYGTLLPLLVLTPVFLAGAAAGDAFAQEVQHRTFLLLRSAPIGLASLLAGKLLVPLLLAPAQVLLWLGLLRLNGVAVDDVGIMLGWSLLLGAVVCGLALAGAAAAPRQGQAQAVYAVAALLVSVASLLLPRDVLNTTALLATGAMDGAAWATVASVAAAAAVAMAAGLWFGVVQLRRDRI